MTAPSFFAPAIRTVSICGKIVFGMSLLLVLLALPARATSTLPFYESFPTNYAEGSALTAAPAATVWDSGNGAGAGAVTVASAAALSSASGLLTSNGSRGLVLTGTPSSNRDRGASFTSQTLGAANPTVYVSFLLNVQVPATSNRLVAYLRSDTSQGTPHAGIFLDASNRLSVSKNSLTPAASVTDTLTDSQSYLVVLRYKWISAASGDDEVALWLNPGNLAVAEGLVPAPTIATTSGSDLATMASFMIGNRSASGTGTATGTQWIDEVRVGLAWADVTPTNGTVVTPTSAPVITQALLVPQGMILRGTNGTPASAYQVIASTNLAVPATNWPAIATHSFDGSGNFDSTNPVSPGLAQQFFRLLVGGTNPPAPSAPNITNQPQSLTVAVGANANFLVGASGTAPFDYFWSFNTNTPVGGNSSTLSLSNVTTNDAGAYRVIVSNSVGTATSSVATLTVLIPPAITANPTNLTVAAGGSAAFDVTATGSATLRYQWYFNTNTALVNATSATLTLNSINATNGGTYSVIVTNLVGSVTSSVAVLTVVGPPAITAQPQSQSVTVSNDATFTVTAAGTAPLTYKWFFNTNTSVGGNSNSFTRTNAQTGDAGTYSVIVTNNYGAVTSSFATLTVNTSSVNFAQFNLVGFGQAATGGGMIAETDPAYAKVTNALSLANAVLAFNKTGGIKVIEIMNDLDLGWNEIGSDVQNLGSTPFNPAATPKLHPRLLTTGVSKLDIKYSNGGLTIFSANGATIRHCTFNIKGTHNIIIRNLKFDEMWEWDESSKGKYDGNDWDFIDLSNGGDAYDVWIDHCTFTKAYDGIVDMKAGTTNVTLSWCKYTGDDGATNPNSMVWQQINSLESNKTSYAFYNFLRSNGFSTADIVQIIQGHDKTHLMGSNDKDPANVNLSATFHHQWFRNCWDRVVPRLRAGNVHDFNLYVDDTDALAAKRLRDTRAAAMSTANQNTLNTTYSFNPPLNGTISTENGAILVEKSIYNDCLYPLRNNQTDVTDPTYTGKIMALDSVYHMDNADTTTTDFRGDSTNAPGSTYFGPTQAPVIPFSWNGFTTLPYTYTNVLNDPAQLQVMLANYAGAGAMTWAKTNWLKTAY